MSRANPLRNLLMRFVWDPGVDAKDYIILFASRGSIEDTESIRASCVERVYLRGFEARVGEKTVYIPFHRVLMIKRDSSGEVVYKKGSKKI